MCMCVVVFFLLHKTEGHSGARCINKWWNQSTVHLVKKKSSLHFSPKWFPTPVSCLRGISFRAWDQYSSKKREEGWGKGGRGGYSNGVWVVGRKRVMPLLFCYEPALSSESVKWTSSNRRHNNSNEPTEPAIVQSSNYATPPCAGKCSGS